LKIDFETHFLPKEYIRLLKRRDDFPRFTANSGDESSGLTLEYDPSIRIPRQRFLSKFTDSETRIREMNADGIDLQVLSIPLPGADKVHPDFAVELCRAANDGLAELTHRYPSRFAAFALLPVQAGGPVASNELRRAVKDLGLKGGFVHSNANGRYLDSDAHVTIMSEATKLGVPIFVHPTIPSSYTGMEQHRLASTFGLQVDLSLSLLRLVFSGIFDSLPSLKIIVSHLGSTLPFIMNRIDDEFAFARAAETKLSRMPGEYLRRLYVDTATMDSHPLEFAVRFFGASHVAFASDYPFWDTKKHVRAIADSRLAPPEKEQIFSGTAKFLLGLD